MGGGQGPTEPGAEMEGGRFDVCVGPAEEQGVLGNLIAPLQD